MRCVHAFVTGALMVSRSDAALPLHAQRYQIGLTEIDQLEESAWIGNVRSFACDCDFINIPLCRQMLHIAATMPPLKFTQLVRSHLQYASALVGGFDCELKPILPHVRDFPARLTQYVLCLLADWAQTRLGWTFVVDPEIVLLDPVDNTLREPRLNYPNIYEQLNLLEVMYNLRWGNMSYC